MFDISYIPKLNFQELNFHTIISTYLYYMSCKIFVDGLKMISHKFLY